MNPMIDYDKALVWVADVDVRNEWTGHKGTTHLFLWDDGTVTWEFE